MAAGRGQAKSRHDVRVVRIVRNRFTRLGLAPAEGADSNPGDKAFLKPPFPAAGTMDGTTFAGPPRSPPPCASRVAPPPWPSSYSPPTSPTPTPRPTRSG